MPRGVHLHRARLTLGVGYSCATVPGAFVPRVAGALVLRPFPSSYSDLPILIFSALIENFDSKNQKQTANTLPERVGVSLLV
jgi:hypothetical protein